MILVKSSGEFEYVPIRWHWLGRTVFLWRHMQPKRLKKGIVRVPPPPPL